MRSRAWIASIVVAAIASCDRSGAVTRRVAVLGYPQPPAVALVTLGEPDLVAPWAASFRASGTAQIADVRTDSTSTSMIALCQEVRAKTPGIDEMVVIESVVATTAEITCIKEECEQPGVFAPNSEQPKCGCVKQKYSGGIYTISSFVATYRASSCERLRRDPMPTATGTSARHDIEFAPDPKIEEGLRNNFQFDLDQARAIALAAIQRAAPTFRWNTFPRDTPITRNEGTTVVVGGTIAEGDYLLKHGRLANLTEGVEAVDGSDHSTILRLASNVPKLEPGDELYRVVDMRRTAAFLSAGGGLLRAHGESYGLASSALSVRFAFDRIPVMTEVSLAGDLVPQLDAKRAMLGGAAGLRLPSVAPFAPVAFGELGVGNTYQGSDGGRAVSGYLGVGAGLELAFTQWFFMTGVRQRWYGMDPWKDSAEHLIDVKHPDSRWYTTTIEFAVGGRF
jgi:hypothetical protein